MEEKKKISKVKKFYTILGVLLILLIPIAFLAGIVSNRESYRNEAVENVGKSWADIQTLSTPVLELNIPGKNATIESLKLNNYNAKVNVHTELRKKGIFTVPVYTADVKLSGDFLNPYDKINNFKADLNFMVSDSKGFIEQPKFQLLNGPLEASNDVTYSKNITTSNKFIPFEINYKIRGLNKIYVVPQGQNNQISIEGDWNNPSFEGSFLPTSRSISKDKFESYWSVPSIANSSIEEPEVGVSFLMPVDNYRMAIRAVKYSFLFLALTFLAYFIYEITSKKETRIHQLQYLMMGIAMLIFYLLLVSVSEFIPFLGAYIISSGMTIGLISLYTYFVITKRKNIKFSLLITAIMILLYLFLYILLRLQDLSLILGSLGLFFIMALVMFSTRNVEWYNDNN